MWTLFSMQVYALEIIFLCHRLWSHKITPQRIWVLTYNLNNWFFSLKKND